MAPSKKNRFSKNSPESHTELENARHDLKAQRKSARAERQRKANLDRLAQIQARKHAVTPAVPLED